jgi:AAA15 family ATPase/GTPase
MSQTAEGVKKIGLIAHLIRNRNIQSRSILFFDEPAAHLHPQAASAFVEMLFEMAKADIQLFIATHSYLVLKQFELLAREQDERMPLCVLTPGEGGGVDARFADLRGRIPQNSIVDASVNLFERDMDLSLNPST